MSYWRRPKFWLVLAPAMLAGIVLSGAFAVVCELIFGAVGLSSRWFPIRVEIIGGLVNLYFVYDAFRFARGRVGRLPQPSGFPVILR